jgi:ABC-type Fe3+-hydroxamate transport system substrate-binding protein
MNEICIDQIGHRMHLPAEIRTIVSTVPSQTEWLFDMGLGERIVGVTKFCIHPLEACKSKMQIGGTKQLKLDLIHQLNPDLIIANKEENTSSDIEALQQRHAVWTSDIVSLNDSYDMMIRLGGLLQCQERAESMVSDIKVGFSDMPQRKPLRALYLIWNDPWMAAGTSTFIHSMMVAAGFSNVTDQLTNSRYPIVSVQDVLELAPEVILLSSEPFPFDHRHQKQFEAQFPTIRIQLVDGEIFSWYGSRMKRAPAYFNKLHNIDFH